MSKGHYITLFMIGLTSAILAGVIVIYLQQIGTLKSKKQ